MDSIKIRRRLNHTLDHIQRSNRRKANPSNILRSIKHLIHKTVNRLHQFLFVFPVLIHLLMLQNLQLHITQNRLTIIPHDQNPNHQRLSLCNIQPNRISPQLRILLLPRLDQKPSLHQLCNHLRNRRLCHSHSLRQLNPRTTPPRSDQLQNSPPVFPLHIFSICIHVLSTTPISK